MKEKLLDEVAEIIAGQSPSSSTYNSERIGLPFFQGKADFGNIYPVARVWCSKPIKISKPLDVLLSVRAPVGAVNISTVENCIGRGLAAIRSRAELNYKYLFYFLNWYERVFSTMGNGSTFSAITISDIKKIPIPLPPLETQIRIANALDKADSIRQKDKQIIQKYDELIDSIFNELFGSREDIEFQKLVDLTTKITDGVHAKPNYTEEGIPFISVKNITKKYLDFEDCKFISLGDHLNFTKRCKPETGDILYTKVGATYGRAAIVDTEKEFSLYVSVALIKPDRTVIHPNYLNAVMNTAFVKRQADRSVKGVGVPDLHLVEIKKFVIPVPEMVEQLRFVDFIQKVQKQKQLAESSLIKSEELFNSILQRAFKGELFPEPEYA